MKITPKFAFDRRFQIKLARALYQFPEESQEILTRIEPALFDTLQLKWVVGKLKAAFQRSGLPATSTMLDYELVRDIKLGFTRKEHRDVIHNAIRRLKCPVPDKRFILEKAHEYIRYTVFREFLIDGVKCIKDPDAIDWRKINALLDYQRSFGASANDGGIGLDYWSDTDARIERRKRYERNGVPTQTVLDNHLRQGGLPPKQLGVVLASPGRGKTSSLVYFGAQAVKLGKTVVHISLELDEDMTAEKYDACISRVPLNRIGNTPKRCRSRLKKAQLKYGGRLIVKEFPTGTLSIAGLKAYLQRLASKAIYPDLLIIDYADCMDLGSRGEDNSYGLLGNLYVALRGLAGECNIPIWTASQTNRLSLEQDDFSLGVIADSFKKAAIADFIVGIGQTDEEQRHNIARFMILKNRNGKTGVSDTVVFNTKRVVVGIPTTGR